MAKGPVHEIFNDLDATSAGGTAITLTSGGRWLIMVEAGTWNNADFHLESISPNGTYIIVSTVHDDDGAEVLQLTAGQYRGVVVTANPTALFAYLVPIPDGD